MMDAIPAHIERITKLLVDEGQHISSDQIVIEVQGPNLPNLTLIDLPGLVKVGGDSDDESIVNRIRDLVDSFLEKERTVILAVVPANIDYHNVEILRDVIRVDPAGVRTIPVVTKMDLIDDGAESGVHKLFTNKEKCMLLGYHAVKCRGQRELNESVSIHEGQGHAG